MSAAIDISYIPIANPDHNTSPFLNTYNHLGLSLIICFNSFNYPRDLDVLTFKDTFEGGCGL